MKSAKKFDIVVYGATGFTGQLVAEYLAAHYKNDEAAEMGDGRPQPRQAEVGARRDRRARRHAADRGRCERSGVAEGDGRPDQIGDHDRRPVPALWQRSARGLRRFGHRLFRSLRRADLDAADDRQARGRGESERRAHRVLLRLRLACRSSSARSSCRRRPSACSARRPPRVKGRVRDMRGTLSGGTAASGRATFEAVAKDLSLVAILNDPFALTPGFERPEAAEGQQARLRGRPAVLDRAVHDGADQHAQRPSLQHADGFSLRQGFRLRRDGADRARARRARPTPRK